jgi:hypothetical protein
MASVLWGVKVDSMETLVTTLVHRVQKGVIGTPAIVWERVLITSTENSVNYPVVRIVEVGVINSLGNVITAASSESLESTAKKIVTLDVWQVVTKMVDDATVKPGGKERLVTVRLL